MPALPEDWDRCLAVAAHPDDIEYGTASAVARWTAQGKTVTYLLATRGEAGIDSMIAERGRAAARGRRSGPGRPEVGVDVVEFLDHRDGVVEYSTALRRDIARAIRRHRPEVIVSGAFTIRMIGGMTNQADHRAVGLAALDAARDAGNRWIFPELDRRGTGAVGRRPLRLLRRRRAPEPRRRHHRGAAPARHRLAGRARRIHQGPGRRRPRAGAVPDLDGAGMGGPALGVQHAVLFDVFQFGFDGPPPWLQ